MWKTCTPAESINVAGGRFSFRRRIKISNFASASISSASALASDIRTNHNDIMKLKLITVLLLVISNIFMTVAWYGHLRLQTSGISRNWPLYLVIVSSWGVALLEYSFMIPANRIGFAGNGGPFTLMQLKILQEVITLSVFTILAMFFFQGEKLHWNHMAAFICLVAAVCFAFMPAGK